MIALLDTNFEQWQTAPAEFGVGIGIGQLLTPLTRFRDYGAATYAIDNGAYAGFNAAGFLSLLKRQETTRNRCKFVAVPDVVCSARRTLEVFDHWKGKLQGWPRALVMQNGIEDMRIPWSEIKAVFIGGDDAFKDGPHASAAARAATALGKWVHVGRVNTPNRLRRWMDLMGGVEWSFDGSGVSQYRHMRIAIGKVVRGEDPNPSLFEEAA